MALRDRAATDSSVSGQAVTVSGDPFQLTALYNHDLDVSEEFAARYGSIRGLLLDRRLIEAFRNFDAQSRKHKEAFHRIGLASLLLGSLPLLASAVRLCSGESVFGEWEWVASGADVLGVCAVALVAWNRLGRHRARWCQAMFCRERLRHWHFQLFLDGGLVGLHSIDPKQYRVHIDERWAELKQSWLDSYGLMLEFMNVPSPRSDFYFERVPYADTELARTVCDALWTLRFEHQLRYVRRRIHTEGDEGGLALSERQTLSETIATTALGLAVAVSAFAVVLSLSSSCLAGHFRWDAQPIGRMIAGVSLLLAVTSAGSRAYKAGYTVPDESESYQEYCDRVRELRTAFEAVATDDEKIRHLQLLEEEAVEELRRFLRMKMRATFLF